MPVSFCASDAAALLHCLPDAEKENSKALLRSTCRVEIRKLKGNRGGTQNTTQQERAIVMHLRRPCIPLPDVVRKVDVEASDFSNFRLSSLYLLQALRLQLRPPPFPTPGLSQLMSLIQEPPSKAARTQGRTQAGAQKPQWKTFDTTTVLTRSRAGLSSAIPSHIPVRSGTLITASRGR